MSSPTSMITMLRQPARDRPRRLPLPVLRLFHRQEHIRAWFNRETSISRRDCFPLDLRPGQESRERFQAELPSVAGGVYPFPSEYGFAPHGKLPGGRVSKTQDQLRATSRETHYGRKSA